MSAGKIQSLDELIRALDELVDFAKRDGRPLGHAETFLGVGEWKLAYQELFAVLKEGPADIRQLLKEVEEALE